MADDYAALNLSVDDHLAACLGYFHQKSSEIYQFFTKFEHVLGGFNAAGNAGFDLRVALREQTLYVDHLPYFSAKSGDYPGILKQRAARDNREFIETLIREVPPKAVLLSGKAAMRAFDSDPDAPFGGVRNYSARASRTESKVGPFKYKVGSLKLSEDTRVRVVACNFVGSIYGPNTNDQKYELGTLLSGA